MSRSNQAKRRPKKTKFTKQMKKKLLLLFTLIIVAFGGLCGRLLWITREKGAQYQKQVYSQLRYDSTTLPFRRGDIVDAKGTRLAVSEKVYNLIIDAKVMLDKEDYLEPTLQALETYFPDVNIAKVRDYVVTHPNSSWYVALKQIPYEQKSAFDVAKSENSKIKGVWFEEEYKRMYPNASVAADVIGFVGTGDEGMYGLEEYYNDVLNGTPGREYGYLNEDTDLERTIKPAVDGNTVHSTIDLNVQSIIEKYLKEFNDTYKDNVHPGNGAENVGCIIMEVDTGRVLGMASYPTFDLNKPMDPTALIGLRQVELVKNSNGKDISWRTDNYITQEDIASWTEMQDGQENEEGQQAIKVNLNNLWKNYCINATYEPGSTAKPFTVAAALESGAITGNEHYQCDGALEVGGYTIKCHTYRSGGEGDVTVENSIAWSCNVALMKIGQTLGAEDFVRFQNIFNFGLKTNVDLAGESRTDTFLRPLDKMGPTDLATNSFGQNFNVTMIQMITGFCSLINGGYYYEPHLVDKITNANGATVENIEPRVLKQTVSESTSELIRQYCTSVVMGEGGTGKTARPAGYIIGGKTGTAETIDPNTNKRSDDEYVVSFIGFAPADDPEIAIYVVVDRPNADPQDDAKYATRIVRKILTEVLPYLNIFMTEELSEAEIEELNALQLEITNQYTQKPEEDALEDMTEDTEGEGETGSGEGTSQPKWMSFPIDSATGHRVDPDTGAHYDADTGRPIEGSFSAMGSDVPINDNLLEQPMEDTE